MLQDLEHGRPMEIDALVTAVQEFGQLVERATPMIDAILALIRERALHSLSARGATVFTQVLARRGER